MPCDTRIRTSVPELAKMVQPRLQKVLEADGWYVQVASGVLTAAKSYLQLKVGNGTAELSSAYMSEAQRDEALATIRRSYAARTVTEVSARFGFKLQGSEALLGGAQRLVLKR